VQKGREIRAIEAMAAAVQKTFIQSGQKVTFVTCGPMTNLALFLSVYPELVEGIEKVVFMGGGVGIGNRGAVAGESFTALEDIQKLTVCQSSIYCAIVSSPDIQKGNY
jgi:inosine-uridine nucleoside N-ribohydrolase